MNKTAQNLLLILVGAAALWITMVTGEYLNYVKPGFRGPLVAAAVLLVALGAAGIRGERRDGPDEHDGDDRHDGDGSGGDGRHDRDGSGGDGPGGQAHDHDHGRGPRVAWLLCLPALTIFLIAPPALGSFTASRDARSAAPPPPPAEGFGALRPPAGGAPLEMTLGEYIGRSFEEQLGTSSSLRGVQVRLTGFATPRKEGGWHLNRLKMSCCAGDAIPLRVVVRRAAAPRADSWVQVVGTWAPPASGAVPTGVHELSAADVHPIEKPRNAYER